MKKRFSPWKVAWVLLLVLSVGMGVDGGRSWGQSLNYRLKWVFNASVIGDIYALDRGFFEAAGLNVTVKEGGPERDAIRELELGHTQFGVASADQVIRAISKGSPVVVVAQLFQVNPLQWVYRSDQIRIRRLADLKGKVIGVTFGGNDENIMRTLLAKANLDEGDYTLYSVRYDLTPFYQKKADIWPCYINSQGVILSRKLASEGESVAFLNPADFDVKFVANSVVTSAEILSEQPKMVNRFVSSLLAAWEAALAPENESEALATLAKFDTTTSTEVRSLQLKATRPLIKPSPSVPIGRIDVEAWEQTERIMLTQNQVPRPVRITSALKPIE